METLSGQITCDGCGLAVPPGHIAERLARLELATRFRPVHINTLFIAAAPLIGSENDFYRPPASREFFDPFLKSLGIFDSVEEKHAGAEQRGSDLCKLLEFQRRGYFLSYLSECPIATTDSAITSAIFRLAPTLVRRIRYNYKPKQITILEQSLTPLIDIFEKAGLSPILLGNGQLPNTSNMGDAMSMTQLEAGSGSDERGEHLASGYDSI